MALTLHNFPSCNQKSWSRCGLHTANMTRDWRRTHRVWKKKTRTNVKGIWVTASDRCVRSHRLWVAHRSLTRLLQLDLVADIDNTSANGSRAPVFRHRSACQFTSDLEEISKNQSASWKNRAKIWTHSAFHNKSLAVVCCRKKHK